MNTHHDDEAPRLSYDDGRHRLAVEVDDTVRVAHQAHDRATAVELTDDGLVRIRRFRLVPGGWELLDDATLDAVCEVEVVDAVPGMPGPRKVRRTESGVRCAVATEAA